MRAQEDDEKNERAIYYLSKRIHDYKTRYTLIESQVFTISTVS